MAGHVSILCGIGSGVGRNEGASPVTLEKHALYKQHSAHSSLLNPDRSYTVSAAYAKIKISHGFLNVDYYWVGSFYVDISTDQLLY